MTIDEQRRAENFAICVALKDVEDPDMIAFMATLIQDHDHLREKLETEPDMRKRTEKLEAMRPHLSFKADTANAYAIASLARKCGVQPIYQEQSDVERSSILMPPSRIHEVN